MTAPAHRTYNGRPGITAEYFRRRQAVRGGSVLGSLTDDDAIADALLAELGPVRLMRLAWTCLQRARDAA